MVCRFITYEKICGFYDITKVDELLTARGSFMCRDIIVAGMDESSQVDDLGPEGHQNSDLFKSKIRESVREVEESVQDQIYAFRDAHSDPTCSIQKIKEIFVDVEEVRENKRVVAEAMQAQVHESVDDHSAPACILQKVMEIVIDVER